MMRRVAFNFEVAALAAIVVGGLAIVGTSEPAGICYIVCVAGCAGIAIMLRPRPLPHQPSSEHDPAYRVYPYDEDKKC